MLQEMLTIKSDDVIGRAKAFEAVVKGLDIPEASVPESFNVLVNELKALGLDIVPVGVVEKRDEIEKEENQLVKETNELAHVLEMDKVEKNEVVPEEEKNKEEKEGERL